ncbi:NLI interacting factor-like phosphatase [Orpheovirus IHUMI-LCC2]|uniref:NLI interacting factor-like phosphatase n=1 Tax=Orpheovirus IHUMI-LCC2 TaxID=2023057 RepID=A0A2I2L5S8_9VIRU|nr:NLI interacting factor-like phosphatase [Orpheovirus IHUMI-LCC2]SNW62809.1 NLI interacting factor-like phosphatase [Orpheovirus IHUMI-LCC2]
MVLDLDETLVHTFDMCGNSEYIYQQLANDPDPLIRSRIIRLKFMNNGKMEDMWGILRPGTREFIDFLYSYCKVIVVWSAGQEGYVDDIVGHIFRDVLDPHITFSYWSGGGMRHNDCKPLHNLYSHHPLIQNVMSKNNTFILDDRYENFKKNLGNGILIPPYEPAFFTTDINVIRYNILNDSDRRLDQLQDWLMRDDVICSSDVTLLDKNNIFY